jgi:hypothetical protein
LDDNKKPGARDISDLKARLGLKKTGTMAAVTPQGTPQTQSPQAGGVPAPMSPAAAKPIPSPFAQPEPAPAPAQPAAPPDPRRDPFAMQQAANLAAFYGINQQLPGSADSVTGHESITKPRPWGTIAVFAIVGAGMFGFGNACGRIYQGRVEYNMSIDQAAQIRDEVDKIDKQIAKVTDLIRSSKPTQQGLQPDFELATAMGSLDLVKPDTQKIFHTNYMHFEDPAIERLFNYYNHSIALFDMVNQHAKKTDADKASIDGFVKSGGTTRGDKNYGVVLDMTGKLWLGKFAELGGPVCPDPASADCPPDQLKGFKYRFDSGSAFGEKPIHGKPNEVIFPIEPSKLFKDIAAGSPDILAYNDYKRRIATIMALAGAIGAEKKDVLTDLKKTIDRPKVFVF